MSLFDPRHTSLRQNSINDIKDRDQKEHQKAMEKMAFESNKLLAEQTKAHQAAQERALQAQQTHNQEIQALEVQKVALETERLALLHHEHERKIEKEKNLREWRNAYAEFSMDFSGINTATTDYSRQVFILYIKAQILATHAQGLELTLEELKLIKSDDLKIKKTINEAISKGEFEKHPYEIFLGKRRELRDNAARLTQKSQAIAAKLAKTHQDMHDDKAFFDAQKINSYATPLENTSIDIDALTKEAKNVLKEIQDFDSQEDSRYMKTLANLGNDELADCFKHQWNNNEIDSLKRNHTAAKETLHQKIDATKNYITLFQNINLTPIEKIKLYSEYEFDTTECKDARALEQNGLFEISSPPSPASVNTIEDIASAKAAINEAWNKAVCIMGMNCKSSTMAALLSKSTSEVRKEYIEAIEKMEEAIKMNKLSTSTSATEWPTVVLSLISVALMITSCNAMTSTKNSTAEVFIPFIAGLVTGTLAFLFKKAAEYDQKRKKKGKTETIQQELKELKDVIKNPASINGDLVY